MADEEWQGVAHTHTHTVEGGHGRIETRTYWLLTEPSYLAFLNPQRAWKDVGGIGMVVRERVIGNSSAQETSSYVLSGTPTVERFAQAVHGHWGIEIRCTGSWM